MLGEILEIKGEDQFGVWTEILLNGVGCRLRWIPPGTFAMGSPENEPEREEEEGPQHQVALTQGFWLGETAVTQAQWYAVMATTPSRFRGDELPVENVSWNDCTDFLARTAALGLRLPTEAEWEYACRAGTAGATWAGAVQIGEDGRADVLDEIAWYWRNSGRKTQPVAAKAANPWGLRDMLGNVDEWCADVWRSYEAGPVFDPVGSEAGRARVCRGASWHAVARDLRCAYRDWKMPEDSYAWLGFRVARSGQPPGRT